MEELDQYMLRQTCAFSDDVKNSYDEFAFHKIYHRVNHFCIVDLSAFYFDVLKDRLYISAPNSSGRRSAQTAIWQIGEALVRLLAPIMSFTTEEVWKYLPKMADRLESVHLDMFPSVTDILGGQSTVRDDQQSEDWARLRTFRDAVLKRLEELRANKTIGGGLEAEVNIGASGDFYPLLKRHEDQLRYLLIVSAVNLSKGSENGTGVSVSVGPAAGLKCERCWNYSIHVGEDKNYPTVCERCSLVLKEIEIADQILGEAPREATVQIGQDKQSAQIPDHYLIGDSLKWNASWVEVRLWTELPFWLMVENTSLSIEYESHKFPVSVHDDYFELFFGHATDSRSSVGYRGPFRKPEDLPGMVKEAMEHHPEEPYMWRKCKTYLKVGSRCNEDVLKAVHGEDQRRAMEAKYYLSDLCRAHIPVINKLVQTYRLATYDYFAFEVSPWDVPHWSIEREGNSVSTVLVGYRDWDFKPLLYPSLDTNQKPTVYKLIDGTELQSQIQFVPTPGELELMDALNLMERGDYSGAVRRVTTAIEVIVEDVVEKSSRGFQGKTGGREISKKH